MFWPLLLFVQSGACAIAGRAAEGLVLIDEALEIASRGSGMTLLPEFQVLRGDLLVGLGEPAEPCFQRAFDVARDLDARMPQLRAATRLCGLLRAKGDAEEGRRLVSAVYQTFTEGFATADLAEAIRLIEMA